MRKTLLALVLAAGALGVATTASEAHYRSYGYSNSYTYYQPSYTYSEPSYRYTPSYSYSYEPSYDYQPTYRHRRSYSYGGY